MPHRIRFQALEAFAQARRLTPRLSGARGVAVDGDALLFRGAPEGEPAGIWREPLDGAEAICAKPDEGAMLFDPRPAPGGFFAKRSGGLGSSTAPAEVCLVKGGEVVRAARGHTFGLSRGGKVAACLEVDAGLITTIDAETLEVREAAHVPAAFDPQRAPLVGVSPAGDFALVMTAKDPDRKVSLERVELDGGRHEVIYGPVPGPAFLFAGASERGAVVVLEVRLGDSPQTRLLRLDGAGPEVIFEAPVTAPASTPLVVEDNVYLPLATEARPFSASGPSDLVVVALAGGAHGKLSDSGDVEGQARLDEGGALLVEGGSVAWRAARR